MRILVIDGQGGKIGKSLIEAIKKQWPKAHITAIGTNSLATAAMLKAAPSEAATGENPVVLCAPRADVIIGPIGVLVADALLGEVTPRMAVAVGQSPAEKILIPVNRCNQRVAGVGERSASELIEDAMRLLLEAMASPRE